MTTQWIFLLVTLLVFSLLGLSMYLSIKKLENQKANTKGKYSKKSK